jgi:hypothetical protein
VAIKGAASTWLERAVDAAADLGYDGTSDGHVGDEVAVHDVDVEPVGALLHLTRAVMAKIGEVGAEDGGSNDRRRRHDGISGVGVRDGGVVGRRGMRGRIKLE